MDRRIFLKTTGLVGIGATVLSSSRLFAQGVPLVAHGAPNAEKLGWRLGCQAWSFNKFTFFEAIDKTASLGLHYIEAFPGQKISKTEQSVMGPGLSADERKDVLKKLSDSGVKLINIGVGAYGRPDFEFAKEMGIETIVCEAPKEKLEAVDKLTEEFGIRVALHNHPKPSYYWNPDIVLAACKDRSHRIGACCDTGHWAHSGLNPIECLKKLEGRIVSFHFKDLDKLSADGHDVPWGTGVCDVKGMLAEIHRQKVQAVFSIEYEYNWDNSVPDMVKCVEYFDKVSAELASA
jgi:sugar phosphate isomerase/epimerase